MNSEEQGPITITDLCATGGKPQTASSHIDESIETMKLLDIIERLEKKLETVSEPELKNESIETMKLLDVIDRLEKKLETVSEPEFKEHLKVTIEKYYTSLPIRKTR